MKRLSARQYAAAIDQALHARSKRAATTLAERVLQRLRRDRAVRLWPRILDHLQTLAAARRGHERAVLEAPTEAVAKTIAKKLPAVELTTVINPELRQGIALTINDQRIDLTLEGRLKQLRHSLLSS